jgi:hypothetical protein
LRHRKIPQKNILKKTVGYGGNADSLSEKQKVSADYTLALRQCKIRNRDTNQYILFIKQNFALCFCQFASKYSKK